MSEPFGRREYEPLTKLNIIPLNSFSRLLRSAQLQRSTFREYMSTVVDDENPEVDIKFPGGTLTLSTWREIKQLDFVRHCLQSGFLAQMSNNETLQDIFGADADILMDMENNKMGKVDKRLLMSKNSEQSKTNTKTLTKKRGNKQNHQNQFLDED